MWEGSLVLLAFLSCNLWSLLLTIRVEPWTVSWNRVGSFLLTQWCRDAEMNPTVLNCFRDVPTCESQSGEMGGHGKVEVVIWIPFIYTFWGTNQYPVSLKKLLKLPRGVEFTPRKRSRLFHIISFLVCSQNFPENKEKQAGVLVCFAEREIETKGLKRAFPKAW